MTYSGNKLYNNSVFIYLIVLFGIFPFFMTEGYVGLYNAKLYFYELSSLVFIVSAGIYCLVFNNSKHIKFNYIDIIFCIFIINAFVSTLSSDYRGSAFTGLDGRRQGFITLFTYFIVFLIISRCICGYETVIWVMLSAAFLVALIGVMQFFGIDILGLYEGLSDKDTEKFISTIGNINFFSSYLSLMLPCAMAGYIFTESVLKRVLFALITFMLSVGMFAGNSDCAIIALGASAVAMLFISVKQTEKLLRWFEILIVSAVSIFGAAKLYDNSKKPIKLSGIWEMLAKNNGFLICVILILAVLWGVFFLYKKYKGDGRGDLRFKVVKWLVILSVVSVAALMVYVNLIDGEVPLGDFEHYLRFSRKWGDYRIREYKIAADVISRFSIRDILFGVGPDVYGMVVKNAPVKYEIYTTSAHCEYLQYFITQGITGAISYMALVFLVIYRAIKSYKKPVEIMLAMGLLAYSAQALVNNNQIFSTPFFFTMLGVCSGAGRAGNS